MLTDEQKAHYDTFGFVVLRGLFSAAELKTINAEFRHRADIASSFEPFDGSKRHGIDMMGDDTLFFASLLEDPRFLGAARQMYDDVLGWAVDANRYVGNTYWHHDASGYEWYGVKFAFYLQPVRAHSGALRIIPGSHMGPWREELDERPPLRYAWAREDFGRASVAEVIDSVPGYACESDPGDVVAFDTRIYHSSLGGSSDRHMCTVNFVNYPKTPQELAMTIVHAKQHVGERDNTSEPWNPSRALHPDWLANAGGNTTRQGWIDRWREFSRMEQSQTGYKTVAVDGRLKVVAAGGSA